MIWFDAKRAWGTTAAVTQAGVVVDPDERAQFGVVIDAVVRVVVDASGATADPLARSDAAGGTAHADSPNVRLSRQPSARTRLGMRAIQSMTDQCEGVVWIASTCATQCRICNWSISLMDQSGLS